MKKITLIVLIILSIALFSCKKIIVGKVIDGFGNPLKGAVIKVDGTEFISQTDAKGEYTINYIPGVVKVSIIKDGYTEGTLNYTIKGKSKFKAEPATLFEIPKENGVFILQHEGYKPLTNAMVKSYKRHSFVWWSKDDVNTALFYIVYDKSKVLTVKKQNTELAFFDNDPNKKLLFLIISQGGGNVIFYGGQHPGKGGGFAQYKAINERKVDFKYNTSARYVKLEPGDYAFVQCKEGEKKYPVPLEGSAFVIRIEE